MVVQTDWMGRGKSSEVVIVVSGRVSCISFALVSLSTPPFCHIWEGDTVGSPFIWTNYIQIWTADCGGRSYKGPFKCCVFRFTARLPWKDFFYNLSSARCMFKFSGLSTDLCFSPNDGNFIPGRWFYPSSNNQLPKIVWTVEKVKKIQSLMEHPVHCSVLIDNIVVLLFSQNHSRHE